MYAKYILTHAFARLVSHDHLHSLHCLVFGYHYQERVNSYLVVCIKLQTLTAPLEQKNTIKV